MFHKSKYGYSNHIKCEFFEIFWKYTHQYQLIKISNLALNLENNHKAKRSHPVVFFEKVVLKICSKFSGEHFPCRSVLWNFIEIALRHGYSPTNLLHIFRKPFIKNNPERLLLPETLSEKCNTKERIQNKIMQIKRRKKNLKC